MLSFSLQLVNIPILSRIFPHLLLQSSATRLKAKNTGWMLVTSSSALMQLRHWLQLIHSWLTLVYLRQEYNFVSSCPSQHMQWSSRFSRFLSSPPVTKLLSSPPPLRANSYPIYSSSPERGTELIISVFLKTGIVLTLPRVPWTATTTQHHKQSKAEA